MRAAAEGVEARSGAGEGILEAPQAGEVEIVREAHHEADDSFDIAVLVVMVRRVAPIEQRALLSGGTRWRWGLPSLFVAAGVLSTGVKAWSSPQPWLLCVGLVVTLVVWRVALRPVPAPAAATGDQVPQ